MNNVNKKELEQENNDKFSVPINIAFFGTDDFSVRVLETLKQNGIYPKLIVTTKDKPKGRKLILTPSEVKIWAKENNIDLLEPEKLDKDFENKFKSFNTDLSIVASYGKIIPSNILEIPKYKTINVHPSLLPRLRGASPLQTAILEENETGVTIIKLDEKMDHGPILLQKKLDMDWPPYIEKLKEKSAVLGGEMLVEVINSILKNEIKETEQDHNKATFTKKIEKNDALINLEDKPEKNLRKIRAYSEWPGAFLFQDNKRLIIKKAKIEDGKLVIEKIIPEGKKEMLYSDYLRGKRN